MSRTIEWVRPAHEEKPGDGIDVRRTFLAPHPDEHDPIILWGEDWFRRGAFSEHAHRGFATMTYIADGNMSHNSSVSQGGMLGPGDALWTVAGAGIIHDGQPPAGQVTHGMQLWLSLPASHRMMPPTEVPLPSVSAPRFGHDGFAGRVFAGDCNGTQGPAPVVSPFTFVELRYTEGRLDLEIASDQSGYIYVLKGALSVAGKQVDEGSGARFSEGLGELELVCDRPGLALVAAGAPIRESIVVDGPFVMNTNEEIRQAYADMEAGLIGRPLAEA